MLYDQSIAMARVSLRAHRVFLDEKPICRQPLLFVSLFWSLDRSERTGLEGPGDSKSRPVDDRMGVCVYIKRPPVYFHCNKGGSCVYRGQMELFFW